MLLLDIVYFIILIFFIPFNLKFVFNKEYRKIMKGRFHPGIEIKDSKSIWIHAVSVGEVKSLEKFVSVLKEKIDRKIVLSVTTPSGFRMARNIFKGIDVINCQLDFSFVVRIFFKKINPGIIVLNELEIWPNWISIAKKKSIPIIVINGRMSDKAFLRYKRFSFVLNRFFKKINLILLQGEHYRRKFIDLGVKPESIKVCGNLKADEAMSVLESGVRKKNIFERFKIKKPKKKIILFASTHHSDEKVFVPALKSLLSDYSVIIAPRHVGKTGNLTDLMDKYEVRYSILSKMDNESGETDVLIFDKMGYMAGLMKVADVVFMGGSFDTDIGGHNLYEPAVLGKKIIGGPFYNNFPSMGKELIENGVYSVTNTSEELIKLLKGMSNEDIERSGKPGIVSVKNRSGSMDCTVEEIKKLIN